MSRVFNQKVVDVSYRIALEGLADRERERLAKSHEFELFGSYRKPHCVYCGVIKRWDNELGRCWERL